MEQNEKEMSEEEIKVIEVPSQKMEMIANGILNALKGSDLTLEDICAICMYSIHGGLLGFYVSNTQKEPDMEMIWLCMMITLEKLMLGRIRVNTIFDQEGLQQLLEDMARCSDNPAMEKIKNIAMNKLMKELSKDQEE